MWLIIIKNSNDVYKLPYSRVTVDFLIRYLSLQKNHHVFTKRFVCWHPPL